MRFKIKKGIIEGGNMKHKINTFNYYVPNLPFSTVSFWFRAGSRFEPESKAGLAHLFEHAYMKRTQKHKSVAKRLEYIEANGILQGAFTSQDPVYYYTLQDPNTTKDGYDILLDGLYHSIIDSGDLLSAKKSVTDELKRSESNDFNTLWNLANQGLWPNSSLAHNPLGTVSTIKRINQKDLDDFRRKYYKNSNMIAVIVSPNKRDLSISGAHRGAMIKEENSQRENFEKPENLIIKNSKDFVLIAISFRTSGQKTNKEVACLRLVKNYLAGGWISRLNSKLRLKENLTYHVEGYIRDFPDTGMLRFVFSTPKKNVKQAIKLVNEEVNSLKTRKIFNKILDKHKQASKIGILSNSFIPRSVLLHYGWTNLVNMERSPTLTSFLKIMDKLTPGDIMEVAQKHLEKSSIAGIGNINLGDLKQ